MMPSVRKETDITKLHHSIPALTTESAKEKSEIIDTERIVCSPAKKWAKIVDKEHIVVYLACSKCTTLSSWFYMLVLYAALAS